MNKEHDTKKLSDEALERLLDLMLEDIWSRGFVVGGGNRTKVHLTNVEHIAACRPDITTMPVKFNRFSLKKAFKEDRICKACFKIWKERNKGNC